MKIKSLRLKNFKGIKEFKADFGCADTAIFGDNGTGKTTINDAVSWLLFDKDSSGAANFSIKTLGQFGNEIHNLDHEVEAEFVNGKPVTLKKVYKEKWTKKRGAAEAEFSGHTTDHYIDDVPVSKKEYQEKVTSLGVDEQVSRLLTNPAEFPSLHWQKQREILLSICGDITDERVIEENEELAGLPDILDGKTCEDRKKIILVNRTKINKDLDGIPARIDEVEQSKPEIKNTNHTLLIKRLGDQRQALKRKQSEVADAKAGGGAAKIKQALVAQESVIADIQRKHTAQTDTALSGKKKTLSTLKDEMAELSRGHQSIAAEIGNKTEVAKTIEETILSLRARWFEADERVWSGDSNCPTCKQPLPEDQIEAAKAAFNTSRAKDIARINESGATNKAELEKLQKQITDLQAAEKESARVIEETRASIQALESEIENLKTESPAVTELPEYKEAIEKRDSLQSKIDSGEKDSYGIIAALEEEAQEIQAGIDADEKSISSIEALYKANDRIEELTKQQKKLAQEFEELDGHLHLIDLFTRRKVAMLDELINERFSLVRFKLAEVQVNGGIKDVCEITVNGVPYSSVNSAGKVKAGLDIIKTLQEHYNFRPMIFVDCAESITEIPEMPETQVITLAVSAEDRELRVGN